MQNALDPVAIRLGEELEDSKATIEFAIRNLAKRYHLDIRVAAAIALQKAKDENVVLASAVEIVCEKFEWFRHPHVALQDFARSCYPLPVTKSVGGSNSVFCCDVLNFIGLPPFKKVTA
jgi:hypothetical protein